MREYGYQTQSGYRGRVNGKWMLFTSYEEYIEYLCETEVESEVPA